MGRKEKEIEKRLGKKDRGEKGEKGGGRDYEENGEERVGKGKRKGDTNQERER
jgi:hypothetical protein